MPLFGARRRRGRGRAIGYPSDRSRAGTGLAKFERKIKRLTFTLSLICLTSSLAGAAQIEGKTCPLHSGDAFLTLDPDAPEIQDPVLVAIARRLMISQRAAIARLGYAGNLMMLERHFPKTVSTKSDELLVGQDARAAVRALLNLSDDVRLRKLIIPEYPPSGDERPGVLQGLLDYGRDVRQVTCLKLSPKTDVEDCEPKIDLDALFPKTKIFDKRYHGDQVREKLDVLEDFEAGMALKLKSLRPKKDRTDYVCHVAKDLF